MKQNKRQLALATAVILMTSMFAANSWAGKTSTPSSDGDADIYATDDVACATPDMKTASDDAATAIKKLKTDGKSLEGEDAQCFQKIMGAVNRVQSSIASADTTMNSGVCKTKADLASKNVVSSSLGAKSLRNLSQNSQTTYANVSTTFDSTFHPGSQYPTCSDDPCTNKTLAQDCINIGTAMKKEIEATSAMLVAQTNSSQSTLNKVRVGEVAVAAIATVAIVEAVKSHNASKAKDKIASDYANGIIHNADGTTTNCLTTSTYTLSTCQPVLINYCSVANNTGKPGCTAFNNSYCASTTSSQSYCLTGTSTTYCAQAGTSISASPACQWLSSRAATCTASSTDMGCLSSMSASQLTSLCPSFPNDPLCASFTAGNVVTQAGTATTLPVTTTTPITTLNSVVGSTTTASTTPVTTTVVPVGVQIKAATPVANVWANNSQVLSQLCSSGQMAGCK